MLDGSASRYSVQNGCLTYHRPTKQGEELVPLCNFSARITRQITIHCGRVPRIVFRIEGRTWDGRELRPVEVPASGFARLVGWATAAWGLDALVPAGYRTQVRIREAILYLSRDAEQLEIHPTTPGSGGAR